MNSTNPEPTVHSSPCNSGEDMVQASHTQRPTVILHPARHTVILNYIIHCQLYYLPKVANYIGPNVVRWISPLQERHLHTHTHTHTYTHTHTHTHTHVYTHMGECTHTHRLWLSVVPRLADQRNTWLVQKWQSYSFTQGTSCIGTSKKIQLHVFHMFPPPSMHLETSGLDVRHAMRSASYTSTCSHTKG